MKKLKPGIVLIFFACMINTNWSHAQDSLNVTLMGLISYWDKAKGIALSEDYVYVADRHAGLRIVDISDPAFPIETGFYDIPEKVHGVAISGDYTYVTDVDGGFRVVDISDPTAPVETGFCNLPRWADGVVVSGDYAFVANANSGLRIIDISDPANPVETGFYEAPYALRIGDVAISGTYAYVAAQNVDLRVVDISDPTSPVETGHWDTMGSASAIAVSGDNAYLAWGDFDEFANRNFLSVIDISNPSSPLETGVCEVYGYGEWGISSVAVSGNFAYISSLTSSNIRGLLSVVNISDPFSPYVTGNLEMPDYAHDIAVSGEYAYVADDGANLRIVNVSDETSPVEIGFYDTGNALCVDVSGNYAYITLGNAGLMVIDISDPASPTKMGLYDIIEHAREVVVSGEFAYITANDAGLRVVDISDPNSPVEADFILLPGYATYVAVSGDFAYVGNEHYIYAVDISDPYSLQRRGTYDPPDEARGVVASEDYVYVAAGNAGLRIVDFSDTTNPIETGYYNALGYAWDVDISGEYAYVAFDGCWSVGLQVVDISDPTSPLETGFLELPGTESRDKGVSVSGDYAYVAVGWDGGLRVINISDPANPVETGFYDTPGNPKNVAVAGNYAYVADVYYFEIFDCSEAVSEVEARNLNLPSEFTIESVYPNPFNPSTSIVIGLPQTSELNVRVFNILGERIEILAEGNYMQGYHKFSFDAEDISSGIYFIRATVPRKMDEVRKIVFVR